MKSEQLDIKRRMTKKDFCNSCNSYIDQEDLNRIEFIEANSYDEARDKVNALIGLISEEDRDE
jgi:hypothetical protein